MSYIPVVSHFGIYAKIKHIWIISDILYIEVWFYVFHVWLGMVLIEYFHIVYLIWY